MRQLDAHFIRTTIQRGVCARVLSTALCATTTAVVRDLTTPLPSVPRCFPSFRKRCSACQATLRDDGELQTSLSDLSDGPDLFVFRSTSNLGAMQDSLKGEPNAADIKAMQDVPNRGTAFEGIYIDGPAIFGSSVLLAVLLVLLFNQVFGLDRLVSKVKQKRQEAKADKEKWAIYNARQQMEKSMSSIDENGDRPS